MPSQTVGNVHVDVPLSNLARKYMPSLDGMIADKVAPYLPVRFESGTYYVWDQDPFFATDVDDLVPDREEPRVVELSHSTSPYRTQRRELAWDISDRERNNADDQLDLETTKQQATLARLALKREVRVAAALRKTTNGGQLSLGANASAKWDASTSTYQTIATDIMAGKTAIRQAIGQTPNVIIIPAAVAEGMHKSLLFQLTQQAPGAERLLTDDFPVLPAVLFGMRVLVGGQIKNGAVEGQTGSYTDIWDEQVRMLYVSTAPAMTNPSVMYTFRSEELTTRTDRMNKRRIDWYAVGQNIDERVVAPNAGYEINDCLT